MNKKLYVGGLPYSMDETALKELFTPFGTVESARLIVDKFTGRSRGFGFVEMATDEDAQKAIDGMNGKDVEGRSLLVNEARPEGSRERPSFGNERFSRGGGGGGEGRGGGGGGRGGRGRFDRGGGGGGGRDRW